MNELIPLERIENKIYLIRGQKVMIDRDLAELYEVETKYIKRQVKRNLSRFPADFMFQLTQKEYQSLRCHFGTLKRGRHSKYLPFVFTEQGIAMLSSVLNSERAIQINIIIMRTFVRLCHVLATHKELARKFKELKEQVDRHDFKIKEIIDYIQKMMTPVERPTKRIGFLVGKEANE